MASSQGVLGFGFEMGSLVSARQTPVQTDMVSGVGWTSRVCAAAAHSTGLFLWLERPKLRVAKLPEPQAEKNAAQN